MVETLNLAVVGNGTSAVNAIDAFVKEYTATGRVLPPITITMFGATPADEAGRGFAFGRIGGVVGDLTESPKFHADYQSDPKQKGAYILYEARHTGMDPQNIDRTTRKRVGAFHHERFRQLRDQHQSGDNIEVGYTHALITNFDHDGTNQYKVISDDGREFGGFDRILMTVGDKLSNDLDQAVKDFPNQVFATPYDLISTLGLEELKGKVIVTRGGLSSMTDLGLEAETFGYKVIAVSTTGKTSWPAREGRGAEPIYFLNPARELKTVTEVLQALKRELCDAQDRGAFVPDKLLQISSHLNHRLTWNFDWRDERDHANEVTYHDVVGSVKWESIYEGLENDQERQRFQRTLGEFILYNRVNRIVPYNFGRLTERLEDGSVTIVQSRFEQSGISRGENGKLNVKLANGQVLEADYVVNCAIGPAPAQQQAVSDVLLRNQTAKGWLTPAKEGTRFDVKPGLAIDIIGNQARPYAFSSIGIETYGRQAIAWAERMVAYLTEKAAPVADRRPIARRDAHV